MRVPRRSPRRSSRPCATGSTGHGNRYLANPEAEFHDLGANHFTRHINPNAKKHNHIRQLEALGYKVTLEPAA